MFKHRHIELVAEMDTFL